MAWYDIPQIKVRYVYDENGKAVSVLLRAKDFEKLVEKMEDFLDNQAIEEHHKQKNPRFYTHEEVKKMIERKR